MACARAGWRDGRPALLEDQAPLEDQAQAALASLDKAIAHKPRKDDADFAAATEQLCRLRDTLLAESRQGKAVSRAQLEQVNALISVVLAGHFPLGKVPWAEIERARDVLAALAVRS